MKIAKKGESRSKYRLSSFFMDYRKLLRNVPITQKRSAIATSEASLLIMSLICSECAVQVTATVGSLVCGKFFYLSCSFKISMLQ